MTDIVFAHDGTVAKIVGDAMHILFGAPGEQPDHADRAVACSLALDAYSQSFRERWQGKGVTLGITRIGAHAGPAIVGNFGGGRFFDYTAHGDTINVASRLEVANKRLGTRLLVNAALATLVKNFCGRPVGDLMLRGRMEAIRTFEPFAVEGHDQTAYRELPESVCVIGGRRPKRHGSLRRARWELPYRSTCRLSSQTAIKRCVRHKDYPGLTPARCHLRCSSLVRS
jgi:hypothetical protein